MKIVATLFFVTFIVGMSSGQSRRYQSKPTDVHLLDVLQYPCTQMGNLNQFIDLLGHFKEVLQPVCEADAPDGYDATEFCNFLVDFLELHELMPPIVRDTSSLRSLWMSQRKIVGNITKILYRIDINDPSTICPNARRFFKSSLSDLYEEFMIEYYTEVFGVVMPVMESFCQRGFEGYFVGFKDYSPYLQLVNSLFDIGADFMGFQSFEILCLKARLAKLLDGDWSTRRMHLKNIFISAFEKTGKTGNIMKTVLENLKQR